MPGANLRGPPPLRQYPPGRYCNRSRCGSRGVVVCWKLCARAKARSPPREGRRAVSSEPPTLPPPSLPCLRAWAAEHQGGTPSKPCLLAGKRISQRSHTHDSHDRQGADDGFLRSHRLSRAKRSHIRSTSRPFPISHAVGAPRPGFPPSPL